MRIQQKKDTQVSKINRKIGRKQVLNGKEMQVGKTGEDPVVEGLSEEAKIQWKKLPQWKKQKLLGKIGALPQEDGEGDMQSIQSLQREAGGDPAGQTLDPVQMSKARPGFGVRTPKEGAAAFLRENQKRGESGLESLKRKWQITDEEAEGEMDDRIGDGSMHAAGDGREWQEMPQNGFSGAGMGRGFQQTANLNEEGNAQREDWEGRRRKEEASGRSRSGKRHLENPAGLRKKKNKLERLLLNSGTVLQRIDELRLTDGRDISERADQALAKGKRYVDKKIAMAGAKLLKAAFQAVLAALGGTLGILLLPILLILVLIAALLLGGAGGAGRANVSPECERYRPLVVQYAKEHEVEEFTEIIMCIMMQESGGRVPDVMQCSECPFNTKYPHSPNSIPDPEYSIDVGIQNFKSCLESAGCTELADMDGLKLALQSYNFGNGYAEWAKSNYGAYSLENAKLFSNIWAAKYDWSKYGDPEYVPHVLRYYVVSGGFVPDGISNAEAVGQLEMLMETWPSDMDERRGAVIAKGAGLIGKVTYDMYGEDTRAGVDNPRTLDCSSFVAWSFQKSGFTDVPYWSTTGTFVSSANFTPISASELTPGDIGLINTIAAGGNNHVGLYVGKDANGTSMWLHCTSHASPGCSTVTDGPRISYYSAFVIFYRYTGFN